MSRAIILLVEDNPDEAFLATSALQASGSEVVHVRDGVAALEFIYESHQPVAVVLLDLKLPKLGGLDVLKAMRTDPRTKLTPVVVLTNSLAEEDVAAAYRHGCNSYVRKQVNWTEFKETMRRIGEYWTGINERIPRRPAS
jgi:two-component system response regulator